MDNMWQSTALKPSLGSFGKIKGLGHVRRNTQTFARQSGVPADAYPVLGRVPEDDEARWNSPPDFYVQPLNGDPMIGSWETPITSDEAVVWFVSRLPCYRTAVSPVTRGVEIGLAHGYWISGPWIKWGPYRSLPFP